MKDSIQCVTSSLQTLMNARKVFINKDDELVQHLDERSFPQSTDGDERLYLKQFENFLK